MCCCEAFIDIILVNEILIGSICLQINLAKIRFKPPHAETSEYTFCFRFRINWNSMNSHDQKISMRQNRFDYATSICDFFSYFMLFC